MFFAGFLHKTRQKQILEGGLARGCFLCFALVVTGGLVSVHLSEANYEVLAQLVRPELAHCFVGGGRWVESDQTVNDFCCLFLWFVSLFFLEVLS